MPKITLNMNKWTNEAFKDTAVECSQCGQYFDSEKHKLENNGVEKRGAYVVQPIKCPHCEWSQIYVIGKYESE